jgi:hypothetical protein
MGNGRDAVTLLSSDDLIAPLVVNEESWSIKLRPVRTSPGHVRFVWR